MTEDNDREPLSDKASQAATPAGAVFLSYASEDAAAAERIATALRGSGIEVWFDKSELRGGDVWDRKINEQIRRCQLFIPIISAHTEARDEGYFRREWGVALDRMRDMAERKAFLVPVVIDATAERGAAVPERFRQVQWSRLVNGEATPEFASRITVLLGTSPRANADRPALVPPYWPMPRARPRRAMWALLGTAALTIAAASTWLAWRYAALRSAAPVGGVEAQSTTTEKSIAVLPFVSLSDEKNNEYFSDGLSEELIDMLTKVPELRVPARTSSFYFKGKQATIAEIAHALNVAHVLEGSVRRSGNHLRVTAQLVRADNGYHVWSETYDRKLDDIFKIQDDIAGAVVTALQVSLLEGGQPRATSISSTEAYTLYLQARAVFANAPQLTDCERAIEDLRRAVKLDSSFARAWAALAIYRTYAYWFFTGGDHKNVLAEAGNAAEQALKLDTNLSDAHLAMAQVRYYLDWDWTGAGAEIDRALTLEPGSAPALFTAANIALTRHQYARALQLANRAVARDPLDAWNHGMVASAYLASGNLLAAEAAWVRALDLAPKMSQLHLLYGYVLVASHKPTAALEQMNQETDERYREAGRALALDALGRRGEADRALAEAESKYPQVVQYPIALVYANHDDRDRAFAWLDRAYQLHDGWIPTWLPWDPLLSNLRSDSRYKAFLRKMNLPE